MTRFDAGGWHAYHVNSEAYPAAERAVHHTEVDCPVGNRIRDEDRWIGTGHKRLCPLCASDPVGDKGR